MTKKYHMRIDISGFLRMHKRKRMDMFTDENGKPVSDAETRAELARLLSLGHVYLPTGGCDNFDPLEKGCMGHEVTEKEKS